MPTKTAGRRRPPTKPRRPGSRVTRVELEAELPGLVAYLVKNRKKTFAAELRALGRPRWKTPPPPTAALAAGVYFDVAEVDRILQFCRLLRHVKGRQYAGRPFVPDLWQIVYVLAPAFGWRHANGLRYYNELYVEVPRKNGKSTLAAAIALYLLTADREPGAEVISAAKDREQARAVFDVAERMARAAPALRRRLSIAKRAGRIEYDRTGSTYKVVSSDKGGLSKHGLNLHGAVVDELHVINDRELINTIETGTGSRAQPLIVYITTAGIPTESPVWADKRDLAVNVSEGKVAEPANLLVAIYAADPVIVETGAWRDPAVWEAANPGYGSSVRPEYLAQRAARAELTTVDLNGFLRLHLGIPTEAVSGWLDLSTWDRSASIVDEADLRGVRCFAGLDLASSTDLAAFVAVFPDDEGQYLDVVCRFWTPADTITRREHSDRADYAAWVRAGFLRATPGETINYDAVEADLVSFADAFDLESLDYDPWGAKQLRDHLEDAGLPLFDCRQGFASLSPPMKETARLVIDRRLRHGGQPVLRWCIGNTTVSEDPAGNIKPDRKRSKGRIDGTAALVMAVNGWLRDAGAGVSAYEDHDLDVIPSTPF